MPRIGEERIRLDAIAAEYNDHVRGCVVCGFPDVFVRCPLGMVLHDSHVSASARVAMLVWMIATVPQVGEGRAAA